MNCTRLLALVALAVITVLSACKDSKGDKPPVTRLVVGTDIALSPMDYIDESTKDFAGFEVAVVRAIAEAEGLGVEFRALPKDQLLSSLDKQAFHVALAAFRSSDELKRSYQVSDEYVNAGLVVVAPTADGSINSLDDARTKGLGVVAGSEGAGEASRRTIAVTAFESNDQLFAALAEGKVKAALVDAPTAVKYVLLAKEYPAKFRIAGKPLTNVPLVMLSRKDDDQVRDIVQRGLGTIRGNGQLEMLKLKWNF